MAREYRFRIADNIIQSYLSSSGAVLIEGPKWCGKTWTGIHHAKSILMMQDPDQAEANLLTASIKPSLLLAGETPRLIDEWQVAPELWDAVRFEVDQRGQTGQFILTGSAVPADGVVKHSGTGRIARLRMRPMSLFESCESTGQVSLHSLFNGEKNFDAKSLLSIEEIASVITRGGWPASIGVSDSTGIRMAENYVEAIINQDISRVDRTSRSPTKARHLLRSLARNVATLASSETIRQDVLASDELIAPPTMFSYLDALERIFVIENQPAWTPRLRSKTAIRSSPKRHFVDPSIATAVLRVSAEGLKKDFNTFGYLFESLCVRDLRIYVQRIDGEIFHYRDKTDLEIDAIISLRDGRWAAIEVKMGSKQIDEGAENLLKVKDRVDKAKMSSPSFLLVLTATQYAYQRKDGVWVVPLGCLRD